MKNPLIDIIAGARPNFMKIAPIVHVLEEHRLAGGLLRYRLVHTGQHYDSYMSDDFFNQLGIPKPDINLEVGSGTQAEQTALIMVRYEKLLVEQKSDLCVVVGDVNSTMACSVAARKLGVPVAHVEGGLRSGDWSMPEEINRIVTDSVTNYFFTTSEYANRNLMQCGVTQDRIFFVGNTMIDTLLANMCRLCPPALWNDFCLDIGKYFVLTLHRPSNVDEGVRLFEILMAVGTGGRGRSVIFPVHPRTEKTLRNIKNLPSNICLVKPQPYLEFNYLVKNAQAVITDSGGITEETTVMGIPCMTLRDTTERPETIAIGTNELIGTAPTALAPAFDRLFAGKWKKGTIPEKWDGKASSRIVKIIDQILNRV